MVAPPIASLKVVREIRCLLLDSVFQHVYNGLGTTEATNLIQVVGVFVTQKHGSHGLDIDLVSEPLGTGLHSTVAVAVYGEGEGALIPG